MYLGFIVYFFFENCLVIQQEKKRYTTVKEHYHRLLVWENKIEWKLGRCFYRNILLTFQNRLQAFLFFFIIIIIIIAVEKFLSHDRIVILPYQNVM